MTTPAITVEALPAGYGDCLLISCPVARRTWRLLIDTGPDECLPTLVDRLKAIPPNAQGTRRIDLAVISHIDHDHIGGAARLFADKSLNLEFGDVWFNAPGRPGARGVGEGVGLAAVLGATACGLPWNLAFGGRDVVTGPKLFSELPRRHEEPRITLLSPTRETLDALYRVWARELPKVKVRPEPEPIAAPRGGLDVEALALIATPEDRARANGSSIAFLLEHGRASVLLTAGAFPSVLQHALAALAVSRGQNLPWQLDLFKLSHHGSRGNTTSKLLDTVQARHVLVSTNGAIFGHPDPEAIARVVSKRTPGAEIWFNFRTTRTEVWADEQLQAQFGYAARLPSAAGTITSIHVGSDRRTRPVCKNALDPQAERC